MMFDLLRAYAVITGKHVLNADAKRKGDKKGKGRK